MAKVIGTKKVSLSELKEWEENPRSITTQDFQRLINQINRLGVYQPLVVNEDMVVLSGNMRLKAFKKLHIDPVLVMMVEAKTKKEMLEYAVSANDQAGYYEEEDLAELLTDMDGDFELEDYKINFGAISLDKLLKKFGPGEELSSDNPKEDKPKKMITCPSCHYAFEQPGNTRRN